MEKTNSNITVNDLVNVKDIRDNVIYTKDNYMIAYIRVYAINIDLLPREDRRAKTQLIVSQFDADKEDFAYVSYPREIDLSKYVNHLRSQYDSEVISAGRKRILAEMIKEASELVLSSENYEHQHFIKIWRAAGSDINKNRNILITRAGDIQTRYSLAGIKTELVNTQDLIKLCNLFANGNQAVYDNTTVKDVTYPGIPIIN